MVTHIVVGYNPFRVRFIEKITKATTEVEYAVVLTSAEIKAEYDYVHFGQKS